VAGFRRIGIFATTTAIAISGAAHAELGGTSESVNVDSARMGARLASTPMGKYTQHDMTRANGGLVHELTNSEGQVFAVAWSGPGKPDLRVLLGRYFSALQNPGGIGRTMHSLRRPVQVEQPDLRIQAGGHMGWFHGVAYVPSLAPPGFSVNDLPREH